MAKGFKQRVLEKLGAQAAPVAPVAPQPRLPPLFKGPNPTTETSKNMQGRGTPVLPPKNVVNPSALKFKKFSSAKGLVPPKGPKVNFKMGPTVSTKPLPSLKPGKAIN